MTNLKLLIAGVPLVTVIMVGAAGLGRAARGGLGCGGAVGGGGGGAGAGSRSGRAWWRPERRIAPGRTTGAGRRLLRGRPWRLPAGRRAGRRPRASLESRQPR